MKKFSYLGAGALAGAALLFALQPAFGAEGEYPSGTSPGTSGTMTNPSEGSAAGTMTAPGEDTTEGAAGTMTNPSQAEPAATPGAGGASSMHGKTHHTRRHHHATGTASGQLSPTPAGGEASGDTMPETMAPAGGDTGTMPPSGGTSE